MSKLQKVNVRRSEIMPTIEARVTQHYESQFVNQLCACGNCITIKNTTIQIAQQFGFCYGVGRAINLAYAAREVFPEQTIYLIGEIIHNPEVNRQLDLMGIKHLNWEKWDSSYDKITKEDVVIIPAFGAPVDFMKRFEDLGVSVVDTTCGDVMKVWKRVRDYAKQGFTSIIHGKANHEETRATASRALGEDNLGKYLLILTEQDCNTVCDYIIHGGDKDTFLEYFQGSYSEGFNPETDLKKVGIANQTTMLKSETEQIQNKIRQAIEIRDGNVQNFLVFDTICGATQERQNALFGLLNQKLDLLFVVGGYNSSNTTHLVEIGKQHLPTFFIRDASCLKAINEIIHYDLADKKESLDYKNFNLDLEKPVNIGITAGASCPANLIEDTILRILELRQISREEWDLAVEVKLKAVR